MPGSSGGAEIAVMLTGPLAGLALPLLPAQILWVNLLTHGLPGVALGGEPADPAAMHRPPRPPAESVLGAALWQRVIRVGVVIAAVALGSRARPGSLANPALLWAVTGALGLQFAALYVLFLSDLLVVFACSASVTPRSAWTASCTPAAAGGRVPRDGLRAHRDQTRFRPVPCAHARQERCQRPWFTDGTEVTTLGS